jgi:hypothetical protein
VKGKTGQKSKDAFGGGRSGGAGEILRVGSGLIGCDGKSRRKNEKRMMKGARLEHVARWEGREEGWNGRG